MIRLYMIRHGETLSNVWKIIQGWSDTPLTEKGIEQGKEVARLLKDLKVASIYSSTSERAYDTACFINSYHDLNIKMMKGLKEMNFGSFETQSEYILGGDPRYIMTFDWTRYGGENIEILTNRVGESLCSIVDDAIDGDNIICVTHSIAILGALRYIDKEVYNLRIQNNKFIDNCSVTILEYERGKFSISEINIKNRLKIYHQ